jgi:hypothetical protein
LAQGVVEVGKAAGGGEKPGRKGSVVGLVPLVERGGSVCRERVVSGQGELTCTDRACRQPGRRAARAALHHRATSNLPGPGPDEIWLRAAGPAGRVILVRPQYSPQIVTVVRP